MVIAAEEQKVLVVDDEELIRRVLVKKLGREGYVCSEAGSAHEALDKIRQDPPQLVLLDVMMPGKTGLDLLPEIVDTNPDIAVVMATAVQEPTTIINCLKGGAQDYVTKPFDLGQVSSSVAKALELKRLEVNIKERQQELELAVAAQKREIRSLFMNSIESLVSALEAKDKYTAGHSRRVTDLALAIGHELKLGADDLDDLHWGALLHDVGKVAIDPAIQNKPGRLTPAEYKHMMTHTSVGANIVRPVANETVIQIVAHHHDRYDGLGLDQISSGEDIPLGARIVAVADSFDAMTSDRPYRAAMSVASAAGEVQRCAGSQFDPDVVKAFQRLPQLAAHATPCAA